MTSPIFYARRLSLLVCTAAPALAQVKLHRPRSRAAPATTVPSSTPNTAASSSSCAHDMAPQARRAHHNSGARRLLQQRAVPPRDRRLHGADRRRSNGDGTGGSKYPPLKAEFSNVPYEQHARHGAWRAPPDPNSANSQFFIMFAEKSGLNGQYRPFGQVVSGMDAVDKLKPTTARAPARPGPTRAAAVEGNAYLPRIPAHRFVRMQVAADAK